jgi:thiol-disulfide isomerase/thioredoxin
LRAVNYDAVEALLSTTLVRKRADGSLERVPLREALGGAGAGARAGDGAGADALHGLSLYFSAHWCPPCRAFTPELAQMHARLTQGPGGGKAEPKSADDNKRWAVIFVSMDNSASAFGDYYASMPRDWLAVPFEDDQLRSVLLRKMNVQGIPTLTFLDPRSAGVEAPNARAAVSADAPDGRSFPWKGASGAGGPGGLLGNPRMLLMLLMLVYYAVVNVLLPWWRGQAGGGGASAAT